jgi:hypothetical protein
MKTMKGKPMTIKQHVLLTDYGLKIVLLLNETTGVFQCQTSVKKEASQKRGRD